MSPCPNELRREDDEWGRAKDNHHRRVEEILEGLLSGLGNKALAERALHKERVRFAGDYRRIYSCMDEKRLVSVMRSIISGKGVPE